MARNICTINRQQQCINLQRDTYLQLIILISIVAININTLVNINYIHTALGSILFLAAMLSSSWNILQYAVLLFLMGLTTFIPSVIWDVPAMVMLIPFLLSTAIIFIFPKAKIALTWLKYGRIDRLSLTLMIVTALVAACALIIWGFWTNNLGVGLQATKALSAYPHWLILGIFIPAFALINAFAEEAVYRGVTQEALNYIFNNRYVLAIVLQASTFAAAHVAYGFPNGKLGYLMTFSYGSVLGYLRYRTNGILASYLTHIVADLVIGYFLFFMAF